jgi:hypothetical protein
MTARRAGIALAVVLLVLSGCSIGPSCIRLNMQNYNEAVVQTESEQFLLNLVRLRYRDPPKALAITNVTASFDVDATAPTAYTVGDKANPFSVLALQAHAADQPTISVAPLTGLDYTMGLVTPIPQTHILNLANTGWDLDRLLRLMVQNMNGLQNVPHVNGKGGEIVPEFHEFAQVAHTFGRLQHEGMLELAADPIPVPVGDLSEPLIVGGKGQDHISASTDFKASDLISAAGNKWMFHQVGPTTLVLRKSVNVIDMNLAPDAWKDFDLINAAQTLKLTPGAPSYRFMPADAGMFKRQFEAQGTDIVVSTRSILSTMGLLSKGIDIPEKHIKEGLIFVPVDASGAPFDWTQTTKGIFHVCVQKTKPKHAFVMVKYRSFWYFIPDDDRESKSTFDLILELFNVQITPGTQGPIITVPVGAGSGGGGGGGGKKG